MAGDPHAAELQELLAEVRRIEARSRRLVGGVLAGSWRSVFHGTGVEFEEVREYVPGDDPRNVDWNVTARYGRPHVKTFVEERERTLCFLLDLSPSMDTGWGPWTARQVAARACAALALAAVRNRDRVGLIACGAGTPRFLHPRPGLAHTLHLLRDVLASPPGPGSGLGPGLQLAGRLLRRHAILFVLSDFLVPELPRSLAWCARRHEVVAVRLLPAELDPTPAWGLTRLRDPASGRCVVVDWADPRVRAAWAARVARWQATTAAAIRQAGADLLDLPVPGERVADPVARPLLEFFHRRELRDQKR